MSEFAPVPRLADLPTELLRYIFPYSHNLDLPFVDCIDVKELANLRSLSSTCRRLREFCLPMLWARVEVVTVRQLGQLRELLRDSPSIAPLIRSFRLLWTMDDDCWGAVLVPYAKEEGTALDLAFRDRLQMWSILAAGIVEDDRGGFTYNGQHCEPPGEDPDWDLLDSLDDPASYDWQAGKRGRGPDGVGEDKLIKSGTQLIDCVTEVVGSLTSIETFGWETPVTPMPRGVFDALSQLTTLTDLRLAFSAIRDNLSEMPVWELCDKLKALSIKHHHGHFSDSCEDAEIEARIDMISSPLEDREQLDGSAKAAHYLAGTRCIMAAARGGQLRRLYPGGFNASDYSFMARAMLPHWVRIDSWEGLENWSGSATFLCEWLEAACLLRRFLMHASTRRDWLKTRNNSSSVIDRSLTLQDLHTLHSYFLDLHRSAGWHNGWIYASVVGSYLPWLVEDAELAQRVLDAWNIIVERGEADKVKCHCTECQTGIDMSSAKMYPKVEY